MPVISRAAFVAPRAGRIIAPSSILLAGALSLFALPGCGHDEPLRPPPGDSLPPGSGKPGESVAITGQSVEVGFALGHMRKSADVDDFRISRSPITVGEYRACVSAGRCETPRENACANAALSNFGKDGTPDGAPLTCTGMSAARQYCTWVGGQLPTLEQWMLAARGPLPKRFPWGETPAICSQHPNGLPEERLMMSRCSDNGTVGQRAAGASVFGVQDVLITTGELLDVSPKSLFPPCEKLEGKSPGHARACVVQGFEPGSIDSVYGLESAPDRPESPASDYGFRCVWGDAS